MNTPKRRWLRFSVRTLLAAVTIVCLWLGWQVSIVQERKMARREIEATGGAFVHQISSEELARAERPGRHQLDSPPGRR